MRGGTGKDGVLSDGLLCEDCETAGICNTYACVYVCVCRGRDGV